MKYGVLDTVLTHTHFRAQGDKSPAKADTVFRRGDIVTAEDLADFDGGVEFLLKNGSIEPIKGTESAHDAKAAPAVPAKPVGPGSTLPNKPGPTTAAQNSDPKK